MSVIDSKPKSISTCNGSGSGGSGSGSGSGSNSSRFFLFPTEYNNKH